MIPAGKRGVLAGALLAVLTVFTILPTTARDAAWEESTQAALQGHEEGQYARAEEHYKNAL